MVKGLKISLLTIIIIFLVAFMFALIKNDFKFNTSSKLIYDETYSLNDVKDFNIDVKSQDIKILSSNDDSISVKVYAKSKKNIDLYKDEDNNIVINKEKGKGSICVGFCFGNYNVIKIYLPKDYDGKFNIKSKSGDITSDIDNYLAFNVKLTSGDIDIKNIKSLVGRTTSGDIEIKDLSSYIDFKTTSGDIEIDNFDIQRDSSITVTSGDVDIDHIENVYVSSSVKSGDVKVKNNDRYAPYELKIQTTSGDITVN